MRKASVAFGLAAPPVLLLAVLAGGGWVAPWPALLIAATLGVSVLGAGLVWRRDLRLLTEALRRVTADAAPAPSDAAALLLLEPLGEALARLSRRLSDEAARADQNRRADAMILDRLPDPLIVLAADRGVRRTNEAARAAFGDDVQAVLRHPDLRAAIERARAERTPQTAELSLPVPVARDVHATVVPLDPPPADGGQAIVVLSDRTRERMVERMRADFVANASHELRTPLASLIGFIETLQGPAADDPAAQQRFLGIMAEQGGRMRRLIEDLLSLSAIEMTEHQPPSDSLDLGALLHRVAAGLEPRLERHRIRLDMRIDDDLPPIAADGDQMAQMLLNLLDNAVKYGGDDRAVRLTARRTDGDARWPARPGVVIAVADQGPGIPRAHLPRLTERFYRVDKGRSRAVGGTGLGLAIVKHIVNRHRGQLAIESAAGAGTTVSVWLPVARRPSS